MRKYLELFKDGFPSDIDVKTSIENKPYVGHDIASGEVVYTVVPKPVVSGPYVTFTAEEDNSSIGLSRLGYYQSLECSTDTSTWNTFDTTTNISLNNGDKVYVRGVLSADNNAYSSYTQFKMSGKIAASGNCNAIWNYQDLTAPLKEYCGYYMFRDCASLTSAPELPATTLANYCYLNMFYNCTSLTTVPVLPATELVSNCYHSMFRGCTSLTTAPELPATELAECCYDGMFWGCTSLTSAPEILPATILANYCYSYMFYRCTSLIVAPELPATELAENCYNAMFSGCSSLTTAPELPATTLTNYCYSYMFNGCTSLTTAPELPATTLTPYCYLNMFEGCTSLTTAPVLPATTLDNDCYQYMFNGCTSINHITCLAIDIPPGYHCTDYWVNKVSNTGIFVKNPNMTKWPTGANGIPEGWTVIDAEL